MKVILDNSWMRELKSDRLERISRIREYAISFPEVEKNRFFDHLVRLGYAHEDVSKEELDDAYMASQHISVESDQMLKFLDGR